ncbi:MAG TPA: gluconate 2-dehydrogenase subunit 3 family protein [Vicinamibacterales bacterium]|jgi:hypothetical protein
MKRITRRSALQLIGAAPAAAALVWTPADARAAQEQVTRSAAAAQGTPFKPKFFTAHEYATVTIFVDLVIPKDGRSGSASEAGVPEFMDFMMIDQPRRQVAMRGGLALIDHLSIERSGKRFREASAADRRALLDDIAYTSNPDASLSHAIAFFSSFRDLTASGFWTSRMGVADLQYQGNVFVSEWTGCSEEAVKKIRIAD